MKHTQLNKFDLPVAIRNTDTFKTFPVFKQGLTLKPTNITKLFDYYQQACRHGIDYLKQNQNVHYNEVKIINEIIKK